MRKFYKKTYLEDTKALKEQSRGSSESIVCKFLNSSLYNIRTENYQYSE